MADNMTNREAIPRRGKVKSLIAEGKKKIVPDIKNIDYIADSSVAMAHGSIHSLLSCSDATNDPCGNPMTLWKK